jgi:hypothetical protein
MRPRSILSALGTAMFVTVASNQALDARQPQKPAVQQTPSPTSPGAVEDVALQIAAANPGVLLTVGWAKSIDAKAVEISFEEVDAKFNKADMARVLLQVTSAVSRFHPNLVVFSRKGNQYLLLAKADLPDVVNEFEHGNKLAAVRCSPSE